MPVRTSPVGSEKAIIRRSTWLDNVRRYLTDSPSPQSLSSVLRRVDFGDVAGLWELQEEMEEKSPHLQGVARTRRMAVLGADWTLEPNSSTHWPEDAARSVANIIRRDLDQVRFNYMESIPDGGFDDLLAYLSLAHGPNICAAEKVFAYGKLVEVRPVPGSRLVRVPGIELLGIETEEDAAGVPFDQWPGKFIVYTPQGRGGFPLRATLTHASVWPYLVARQSSTDWMAFNELHGTPSRIIRSAQWQSDRFRAQALTALEEAASDLVGVLPEGSEYELIQASGKGETYDAAMQWAESKLSILWLGQTLTTGDGGGTGSYALAKVHDQVRADLMLADISAEKQMVETQIIAPMVRLRFPRMKHAPIPEFVRSIPEARNVDEERLSMEQIRLAKELGVRVSEDEIYERLGFEKPKLRDRVLVGQPGEVGGGEVDSTESPGVR